VKRNRRRVDPQLQLPAIRPREARSGAREPLDRYQAVLMLRRLGHQVWRAGPEHHLVNGKFLTHREMINLLSYHQGQMP
jgi:hypothetical protein